MNNIPICKNCRWFNGGLLSQCLSPSRPDLFDPISGFSPDHKHAYWARHQYTVGDCGPDGKWFEQKKSWVSRLLQK